MKYKLKNNVAEFDVVDGPLAGRNFRRGVLYDEIPSNEAGKFETISEAPEVPVKAKAEEKKAEAPEKGEVK